MLIHASFSQELSTDGTSQVYIPEGTHTITPSVNGKPQEITVKVPAEKGEAIALALQASFDARNKKNPVRAIFDFDHKDTGPAAAIPTRFFYEKGQGVMVERELTGSGKKAIKSKDYSYFSPTFLIDKNGAPVGVPERGPLGALVNDPAFRDIPRIAAKEAHTEPNPTNNTMSQLVKCGLLDEAEGAKDDAVSVAQKRVTAMRADTKRIEALDTEVINLKKELKAANASIASSKEAKADSVIEAAVTDGRISAKNEDEKSEYKELLVSAKDEDQFNKRKAMIENLAVKHEGIDKAIVDAKQGGKVNEGSNALITAADALVKEGTCKTQEEAIQVAASNNPDLYDAYTESLTE